MTTLRDRACELIEKRSAEIAEGTGVSKARALAQFLETPEGRRLYADYVGRSDRARVEKAATPIQVAKAAALTELEALAESIAARVGISKAQGMRRALEERPDLYERYRGSGN
jgi:hypothetical protein